MTMWFALLQVLTVQESAEDPRKEIDRYKIQIRELQNRVAELEEASVRDAEMIQRFRTAMKSIDVVNDATSVGGGSGPSNTTAGPTEIIKGRVLLVEPKHAFVLVDLGKAKKLEPGQMFEITRKGSPKGKSDDPSYEKIGSAKFEKYIGDDQITSKLKIVEGSALDMKLEDEAVAIRALGLRTAGDGKPDNSNPGLYKITGTSGTGFIVNYGQADGAKQTALVFIYKDGVAKGKLRLDRVTKEFSVGSLLPPAAGVKGPEVGDQILTRELSKSLAGTVAMVDEKTGRVATDLHARDGVKAGQRLEVRRSGQKVGTLIVTDVQVWGSWTKPEGETKIESIRKGDFIEAASER